MGKCFITKLSAEVNNDDLPIYGKFNINFKPLNSDTNLKRRGVRLAFNKDAELKVIGKGYFTNADKSQNLGTTLSIKGNNAANSIYVSDEVSKIAVDKYTLTFINSFADDSGLSAGWLTFIDIQDIRYSQLTSIMLDSTSTFGDLSSLSNLTNLTNIQLGSTSISGDLSSLSNLTNLTNIELSGTSISGNFSSLSNLTNLTNAAVQNSNVNGFTVEQINKLPKLKHCIIPDISGDIAQIHDGMEFLMIAGCSNCSVSWTANSRQNKKLLCLPAVYGLGRLDFGTDLDNMLIDQATCNYTDIGNYYGNIRVKGTRTSASDAALTNIQNKGVTVAILS